MAERSGFGRGFGGRGGDRGGDRGRRGRGNRQLDDLKTWNPITKLGRLVKEGKITTLEEIYLYSLPIKEHQIINWIYKAKGAGDEVDAKQEIDEGDDRRVRLEDEIMKVMPVQKQTRAGQRTRFKAFVAVGDRNGFVGLGVKCSKEVATAIRGAITVAKLSLVPVRRGYWGNKIGKPHTVPMKVSGKCGSVRVRLIPAPRGALVVGAPTTKKMLQFAGVKDCYTSSTGSTKTRGNFMKALFNALAKTYAYLTPDLWEIQPLRPPPFEEHSLALANSRKELLVPKEMILNL